MYIKLQFKSKKNLLVGFGFKKNSKLIETKTFLI